MHTRMRSKVDLMLQELGARPASRPAQASTPYTAGGAVAVSGSEPRSMKRTMTGRYFVPAVSRLVMGVFGKADHGRARSG